MVRVNFFLFCIKLEVFGLVIGCYNFINYYILAFLCIGRLIFFVTANDLVTNAVCFVALIASLSLLYVYTRFLRGLDHRVPERILWFRNYRIATTVVSALLIFAIWKRELITDKFQDADLILLILYFINLIIDVYVVLCIHSLYKKFEEETLPIKNCPAVIERLQLNAT